LRSFFLGLILVLFLAALGTAWWLNWQLKTPYYNAPTAETFVDIPHGASTAEIADLLVQSKVLQSRWPFLFYVRWSGAARHLMSGEYRFTTPSTPALIVQRLVSGDVYFIAVTVPEGLSAQEVTELIAGAGLSNEDNLKAEILRVEWIHDLYPEAQTLEGFLFPDTYKFSRKADSEEIIKAMLAQFRHKFRRLTASYPIPKGFTAGRIVTLASMIEKEVKKDEERPLVASVLINRLQKRMPLACDPSIIYALKLAGRYDGNIRKMDLAIASPYNTYRYPGLPPGPISNPGESSLRAALTPAKTDYLYFVSRNDGTHQFSKDYRAHMMAVARFQKSSRARALSISRNR
jgi:peptidoglycan lytic transglycosylase G